ncbi:hypothetical protein GQ55_1G015500 [Panicum hallii var. hallii]|uniref:Uncharacterized protein n=1 Tax=Panicum hallii var. hallii TaxID=1504633 RepID=A0A2T7F129_9POAL|nr:hypothetical protein GQ55_1G015500 [Panicum hallii var. hallii]
MAAATECVFSFLLPLRRSASPSQASKSMLFSDDLHLQCPFSQSCWNVLQIEVPLQASTLEVMEHLKDGLYRPPFS